MSRKISMLLLLAALYSTQSMALVCVAVDGKYYPADKEAKDLVAAFKPSTSCDSESVKLGAKLLKKEIVKREATPAERKDVLDAIAKRKVDRATRKLQKSGLMKQ